MLNADFKECVSELLRKYRDVIAYLFFGVCSTLVNIVSYWLFAHPLKQGVMFSTLLAWILSVLFAYFTNRKWVFHSKATRAGAIWAELVSFFACRIATGVLDWVCMYVFVDWLGLNDMVIKVTSNVLVIILNYVASKLIIFKSKK